MVDKINYYFGRLNLIGYLQPTKYEYILNSLKKDITVTTKKYYWGIYNIPKLEFKGKEFIFGDLVKYIPKNEYCILEEKQKESLEKWKFDKNFSQKDINKIEIKILRKLIKKI